MSNAIKYSNINIPNTIRKGNVAFGINAVDYSAAPFFSGISPAVGGIVWIIYVVDSANIVRAYGAKSTLSALTILRQLTGIAFANANLAFVYVAGQPNMAVVNMVYENIVTNGLTLLLDASFTPSYPLADVTWYDLTGNNQHATWKQEPNLSADTSTRTYFDVGVDNTGTDNSATGATVNVGDNFTAIIWYYAFPPSTSGIIMALFTNGFDNVGTNGFGMWILDQSNPATGDMAGCFLLQAGHDAFFKSIADSTFYSGNKLKCIAIRVANGGSSCSMRMNNVELTPDFAFPATQTLNYTNVPQYRVVSDSFSGHVLEGSINSIQLYNRYLTDAELDQNYNAQAPRFV